MRKKLNITDDEAEINLTPMLDIVFIMLIFFIVTATFVRESGIDVVKPPDSKVQKQNKKIILVRIDEIGRIWVDRRRVDIRAVRPNIERLSAEQPGAPVVIQSDKKSKTGLLIQVMDASRLAGVTNISLAAQDGQ